MGQMSHDQVVEAITLLKEGFTQREVAHRLTVSQSVICRAWKRYQETGRNTRRQGSGRKRKTTAAQDRRLQLNAVRNRSKSAPNLQNEFLSLTGTSVSVQTIRNRLREAGLRCHMPAICPPLTAVHRACRLRFAREHVNWTMEQWATVLFTDESKFNISDNDRRRRVWRRRGERFAPCCIMQVDRFGGGSVMVWGGISSQHKTELVCFPTGSINARRYVAEVLEPHVKPSKAIIGQGFLLMHDNARPHTANVTTNFLREENLAVMDWPARSPDLNPIEHVWDILGRQIRALPNRPQDKEALIIALKDQWNNIDQNVIQTLVSSMKKRCEECIRARGGNTSY